MRKITRKIKLGTLTLGGGAPILIQSMTNTDTRNREATEKQILSLAEAGCDVIRFTVPDMESVHNIPFYKRAVEGYNVALVADIHFNYRLAIESAEAGIDKIRINPGNIGDSGRVREVAVKKIFPSESELTAEALKKRCFKNTAHRVPRLFLKAQCVKRRRLSVPTFTIR